MNREELLVLCRRFAGDRYGVVSGRMKPHDPAATFDPVPEIIRSFRHAEISESEKNALLSLVCDPDDEIDYPAETACVRDPYADSREVGCDDDDVG